MLNLPMLIQLKQETNRAKDRQHLPILRRVLAELQNADEENSQTKPNVQEADN